MIDDSYYLDYLDDKYEKIIYNENLNNYYADVIYENNMIERENNMEMKRKIIDLKTTNMTFDEIMNLKDYVWKNDKLIPVEGE